MQRFAIKLIFLGFLLGSTACHTSPPTVTAFTEEEKVIITFADYESNGRTYASLMAQFHTQHPNIQVQFVSLEEVMNEPGYDLPKIASTVDTAIVGGLPHDTDITYFRDLTPLIESDPTFDATDFWPNLLDSCGGDHHTAGLPVAVQQSLIFFDGKVFDVARLPRPKPGWKWDDFQRVVQTLAQGEGGQEGRYGFVPAGSPFSLLAPYVSAALPQFDDGLNSVVLTEMLDWYVEMVNRGAIPGLDEDEASLRRALSFIDDRKAGLWLDFPTNLAWRRDTLGGEIGMVPFPISETVPNTTPATSFCAVMSAGTMHPQEAWAWLRFLTFHQIGDRLPVRLSVAEASSYWDKIPPETEATLRFALQHAWYDNGSSDALQALERVFVQALATETDWKSSLTLDGKALPTAVPSPTDNPNSTAVAVQPAPTDVPEAVTIVDYFAHPFLHANLASVNTLAQAFNQAHPDIKVEPSMDVSADLFEIDAILEQYDCLAWFSYGYQGEIDQLYSLDPLLASEDPVFTDDFRSASLDVFRVGGELYALPAAIQPSVIYYNADYLAKMGLAQPALDWTADDFVTLASLATSREGEDKVFGFVPFQGDANGFLLALQGGSLYDISSELRSVRFTDSNVISAATWRVDFANAGIMPSCTSACSSLGSDFRERERLVMSGHAAMWTNLAGGEGRLLGSGADFEVGVVPLPQLPVPILDSPFAYQGLYISRRAGDPRACWDWLKFLSEQPAAFNGVPARRSVAESEAWIAMVGSETSAAFQAALSRQMLNRPPGDVDWNALEPVTVWWGQAQTAVFRGEDPAVVLTEAQNKADIFLACLASANSRTPEQYDNCAKQADPQFGP